jgi:hypothetical protein
VQQAGIQVPPYCCGCGVKLQQVDPEAPGCVMKGMELFFKEQSKLA